MADLPKSAEANCAIQYKDKKFSTLMIDVITDWAHYVSYVINNCDMDAIQQSLRGLDTLITCYIPWKYEPFLLLNI